MTTSFVLLAARGTETVAVEEADGTYRLYGYKWFSSATDADMTFTLARVVDRQGNTVEVTELVSAVSGYSTCMCWHQQCLVTIHVCAGYCHLCSRSISAVCASIV